MADVEISQSGTLSPKISLFDAKCFDFARLADFDDEAAVVYFAQDGGVRDENLHRGCSWFFSAKALLSPAKTWKDVLHSRENRQKECIDVAPDITFPCSDGDCLHGELCACRRSFSSR